MAARAERAPWDGVRADAIRGHVEFLASDLLEGRAAATRGYDIAAAYVAAQFRQAGLEPGGDEGDYLQNVPLLEATPVLPGSGVQLVREGEAYAFEYGTHYLPFADFTSASSTLTAPLVFVGFGVQAPELEYDDYAGVDAQGRIAVALSGAPEHFPAHQRAYHSWSHRKWSKLIEHGAVGLVMVDSLVDAQRVPWERKVAMSWTPQMRWLSEDNAPQNAYPELKLRFLFNHEAAARLFAGAPLDLEQALANAQAGTAQGFELPGMLTLTATTGLRRTQSANVLGLLPGADPQLRDEYVVLTAHLDHLGRGAAVDGDTVYNGAHDNALGVGVLLETARALAGGPRPRRSILFAALTAEEKGLLGSDYLAHRAQQDGRRVAANVNVDMPLIFAPVRDFMALGAEHSSLGALARSALSAEGYRMSRDPAPEEIAFIRSDQFSFVKRGAPAIALKSGLQSRNEAIDIAELQRTYRRTHYHQPSDDLSLPIDYPTAADLARVAVRITLQAANGPRPRWNRGDFFGERFSAN
jgi:hypothetical protein